MKENFYPSSNLNQQQFESWKLIIPQLGKRHQEVITAMTMMGGRASVGQIALKIGRQLNQVSGRITELRRKKILSDSGEVIYSEGSKRGQTVWELELETANLWLKQQQ